jgi:hypothetical protein
MGFAEKFFRKNIKAAEESGTDDQQNAMATVVAFNSQKLGELSDILSGRRKQTGHAHHPVRSLVDGAIDDTLRIVRLRREIDGDK